MSLSAFLHERRKSPTSTIRSCQHLISAPVPPFRYYTASTRGMSGQKRPPYFIKRRRALCADDLNSLLWPFCAGLGETNETTGLYHAVETTRATFRSVFQGRSFSKAEVRFVTCKWMPRHHHRAS